MPERAEAKLASTIPGRLSAERCHCQCRPPSAVVYRPEGAGSSHVPGAEAQNPDGRDSEPVCSCEANCQEAPASYERYTSSSPGRGVIANTPSRPSKKRADSTSAPSSERCKR